MRKLTFTGHDSFHCRQFWLKKGLDHIWMDRTFNDVAVVDLGVGRNMVTSVRFWVRSFGLLEKNIPNKLASTLLSDDGFDPHIEDIGTLWLLHHSLVRSNMASTYYLFFNEFRRLHFEFSKKIFSDFLIKYAANKGDKQNASSIKKDVDVFIRNYSIPSKSKGIESDFNGLLHELGLMKKVVRTKEDVRYQIENAIRENLPYEVVLFCILFSAKEGDFTFSFKDLLEKENSVGRIFAMNSTGLMNKIEEIQAAYPQKIVFTDNGGIRVLQFKEQLDCWAVLKKYYAK